MIISTITGALLKIIFPTVSLSGIYFGFSLWLSFSFSLCVFEREMGDKGQNTDANNIHNTFLSTPPQITTHTHTHGDLTPSTLPCGRHCFEVLVSANESECTKATVHSTTSSVTPLLLLPKISNFMYVHLGICAVFLFL